MADPVYTVTYVVDENGITIIETPDIPVARITHYSIRELRDQKKQYKAARDACQGKKLEWQAKLDEVQAQIDLYNANGGTPK